MTTPISPPVSGRWAWREYLPGSTDEWLELRNRAIELRPENVDVLRFSDWVLAEMRDEPQHASGRTLSKWRKLLYELAADQPPKRPVSNPATSARRVASQARRAAPGRRGTKKGVAANAENPRDVRYVELPAQVAA